MRKREAKSTVGERGMGTLAIRISDEDLEELKERAKDLRIPPTVYARMLIIRGMKMEAERSE